MRARIGTALGFSLLLGLFAPRAVDRPFVANFSGGRAASPGAGSSTSPAAAPAPFISAVALGPPAPPTVAWPSGIVGTTVSESDSVSESDRIARELLHTDRLISVLRPKVFRSGNSAARELYKAGEIKRAHAKAIGVRDGVLELLRDFDDLPVSLDTASKALQGAEKALERASKELGKSPNASALRLQREALDQLTKARSAFARKEYRDAVIHSRLVERNLENAVAAQRSETKQAVKNEA